MSYQPGRAADTLKIILASFLFAIAVMLTVVGCKKSSHTSDSRLQQMDETLNAQLPQGTPRPRVVIFLNSQSFPVLHSDDAHAVVAIIHRVDLKTLQPVTARATFHFDASDKLTSYELAPALDSTQQP